MLSLEQLVSRMEALPHWPDVLAAYNGGPRVHCHRTDGWRTEADGSPYRCKNIYLGNTIFAPVLGASRLNVLRQLHQKELKSPAEQYTDESPWMSLYSS